MPFTVLSYQGIKRSVIILFIEYSLREVEHDMELHQLRYFICVAKHESMSKAAIELHVSQPALSKSVAKLEAELNVSLFDRTRGHFSLTDSGRIFQKYVERAILVLEKGVQVITQVTDNRGDVMRG